MHICRYYHDDDHLPDEIRATLEDRLYTVFAEGGRPEGTARAPEPVTRTLDRLTATVTFTHLTRGNDRLSERLSHEAVHWVGERWNELEHRDPFADEEAALEQASGPAGAAPTSAELDRLAALTAEHRPRLAAFARRTAGGVTPVRDAAGATEARSQTGTPADGRTSRLAAARDALDREARFDLIRRRWRERLEDERSNHRARLLGRALGSFIRELEEIVPRLAREQRVVRDIFGNEDALWDLARHEWEELPVDGLEQAAATLAEHPELDRLATLLGRSRSVTERRTRITTERRVRLRPVGIGKSEVTGIHHGDDLTSLVASEVGLLAQPETEELFYAKLAHRQLLVLDYNRQRIVEDVEERPVSVSEEVPVERGPAIVCVDTSGSMLGLPERVAKATVLALARRMREERRRLEVIAFSSQVRSFTLDHDRTNLADLARFVDGGFHGGTDLRKALAVAIETLEREEYRHADVLVVSDFRVPKIADRFLERIGRQHHCGTLFHSLTVAAKPVIDPLHIFDNAWLFSTESGRIAPESLRAIE
ncbi:MAG: VWA domain-containing protein [Spirochaetota bacterium]